MIDGRDHASLGGKERAKLVGYVPQSENIAFSFKVKDLILMGVNANVGMSQGRVRRIVSWPRKLYG